MEQRSIAWPILRRVWRRAVLFEQMAKALNIDVTSVSKLDRGDAITCAHDRCFECRNAGECRNWLEASEGLPLPPDFCHNREFFTRCLKHARHNEQEPE